MFFVFLGEEWVVEWGLGYTKVDLFLLNKYTHLMVTRV